MRVCVQELDPRWYVGKVTRGQAEGCLKRVHKVPGTERHNKSFCYSGFKLVYQDSVEQQSHTQHANTVV